MVGMPEVRLWDTVCRRRKWKLCRIEDSDVDVSFEFERCFHAIMLQL